MVIVAAVVIAVLVVRKKEEKQLALEEEDLVDEVDRFTEDEVAVISDEENCEAFLRFLV